MALDRNSIQHVELPKEEVPVEEFGGSVIVRGLLLSERLAGDHLTRLERETREGESDAEALSRAASMRLPRVLHICVVDDAGAPLMTAAQWDTWGSVHRVAAFKLFNTAMRLSGNDLESVEKN